MASHTSYRTLVIVRFALCATALSMLPRAAAAAPTFTNNMLFSADSLSVWKSGPGFTLDTGPRFFGESWDVGKTAGGIDDVCVPFVGCASFGAEIGARTSGRAGIDYGVKIDSGTFAVQYPAQASVSVGVGAYHVDASGSASVNSITVDTTFRGLPSVTTGSLPGIPAQVRVPTLQVTGPTIQAYADLAAEFHGFAGAKVCVGICYGPAIGPIDINASRELAAINRGGDGQIRVLGETVSAHQNVSALNGLLNASFNLPSLDSSSLNTPGGLAGGTLTSTRRDNIATVNANIAQIAADAVGLPIPLSGKLGPIGYNLLQANAGAGIDVQQTIKFTPKVSGTYLFSAPVVATVNGRVLPRASSVDFNIGDTVSFDPGRAANVSFIPQIRLSGTIEDEVDLVLSGNVDVKALGVDVAGLSLGPLIDQRLGGPDLGRIKVFDETFTDAIGSAALPPIDIDLSACTSVHHSGELSFVTLLCASSGYNSLYPVASQKVPGAQDIPIEAYACKEYFKDTVPTCSNSVVYPVSPFVDTSVGRAYLGSNSTLGFQTAALPDPSVTDIEAFQRLRDLGYTDQSPPFVIPEGDPLSAFPVLEPGSIAMVGAGLAALLATRRRKRAA